MRAFLLPVVLAGFLATACERTPAGSGRYGHTGVPPPGNGDPVLEDGGTGPTACPLQLPETGDPERPLPGAAPFGCYGACGGACMAQCQDHLLTASRTVTAADGQLYCVRCGYQLLECKSHASCRWHDDCYRQCDARWAETHGEMAPEVKASACYRACDAPLARQDPECAVDWAQVMDPAVQLQDACWDGSSVPFTRLTRGPEVLPGPCAPVEERHGPPWDPAAAAWQGPPPPASLPRDGPCVADTDCPDRRQRCTPGPGRCADHDNAIDVVPLEPPGAVVPGQGREPGAPCALDAQCARGWCHQGRCRAH